MPLHKRKSDQNLAFPTRLVYDLFDFVRGLILSGTTTSRDGQQRGVEDVYRANYALLFAIATRRFGVPNDEAPALIHDVIISYIGATHEVEEPQRWLLAAICNASRYFQRSRRRIESHELPATDGQMLPVSSDSSDELVITRLTASAILAELKQQYRDVLCLHYVDGLTAAEIAIRMETTLRDAERLIHRSRRAAYEAYYRMEHRDHVGHEASSW